MFAENDLENRINKRHNWRYRTYAGLNDISFIVLISIWKSKMNVDVVIIENSFVVRSAHTIAKRMRKKEMNETTRKKKFADKTLNTHQLQIARQTRNLAMRKRKRKRNHRWIKCNQFCVCVWWMSASAFNLQRRATDRMEFSAIETKIDNIKGADKRV